MRYNFKNIFYKSTMLATATAFAVVSASSAVFAWGPENRPTYTMNKPAPVIAFNSITDSKGWGDERNFVQIKDITDVYAGNNNIAKIAKSSGFKDKVELNDGHIYMVKAFVHNNAAANLNLVATNTRIKQNSAEEKDGSHSEQVTISADNCGADGKSNKGKPCSVWDSVYLERKKGDTNKYDIYSFVDSAHYFNNKRDFNTNGFLLSNDIRSAGNKGALLGFDKMDGNLKGCFDYSGYAVYVIQAKVYRPELPNFTLTKTAKVVDSKTGKFKPVDKSGNVVGNAGDTVEYEVKYKNVSSVQQNSVMAHDYLPNGMAYIEDSLNLFNKNHPKGFAFDKTTQGLFIRDKGKFANISSYRPGSEARLVYRAKLPKSDKLECGENRFENTVMLGTKDVNKIATSIVRVYKKCSGGDKPNKPEEPNKPDDTDKPKVPRGDGNTKNNTPRGDVCQYNINLKASDRRCVKPGVPRAGVKVATATVSLLLFLTLASFITYKLARANKHAKQTK